MEKKPIPHTGKVAIITSVLLVVLLATLNAAPKLLCPLIGSDLGKGLCAEVAVALAGEVESYQNQNDVPVTTVIDDSDDSDAGTL